MDIRLTATLLGCFVIFIVLLINMISETVHEKRASNLFSEQIKWYKNEYGEANTIVLINDLKMTPNPRKTLNEKFKKLNPKLVNQKL